jgi:hypothetical protein
MILICRQENAGGYLTLALVNVVVFGYITSQLA